MTCQYGEKTLIASYCHLGRLRPLREVGAGSPLCSQSGHTAWPSLVIGQGQVEAHSLEAQESPWLFYIEVISIRIRQSSGE